MRRFLPYLWPKDEAGLRVRIVFALLLVVISKLIQLSMAWVYGRAIDRMVPGMEDSVAIAIALVAWPLGKERLPNVSRCGTTSGRARA